MTGALLALLLALPAAWPAQDGPLCGDCGGTGRVALARDAGELELEQGALRCSVFMEADPQVLGLDWAPCGDCTIPDAKARAERDFGIEQMQRKNWLDTRRAEVDAVVGVAMDHVETDHFFIAWNIPRMRVGSEPLARHAALHAIARRMEELHRQTLDLFGITDDETLRLKHELYFFDSAEHAKVAASALLGTPLRENAGGRVSLLGVKSRMVAYRDAGRFPKDEQFLQAVVHSVSHHLHDHVRERQHWLFQRYGWAYEGLAFHAEILNFGVPITWCTLEGGDFQHWKGDNWEMNIKKAVIAGKEPAFQDVVAKPAGDLSAEEAQFAWSWIDYLLWRDATRMDEMLGMMKGPQLPTRDALRDAYGLTMGEFVDGWRAYVRENYTGKRTKARDWFVR